MSQSYRLKILRAALKLKVATRIPAQLTAASPLVLDKTGGTYALSLDINDLTDSLDPIYAKLAGGNSFTGDQTISGALQVKGDQAAIQFMNQAGDADGYIGIDAADDNKIKIGFGANAAQGLTPYIVLDESNGQQVNIGIATYHDVLNQSAFNVFSDNATFASNDNVGTFVRDSTGNLNSSFGAHLNIVHYSGNNPSQAALVSYSARGTRASPAAVQNGDPFLVIDPHVYNGSAYIDQPSGINFNATQTHSIAGNGAKIQFFTTPNNILTGRVTSWTMDQDGGLFAAGQASSGAATVTAKQLFAYNNGGGAASFDGIVIQNSTAAAPGAQQFSPALRLSGFGWKTNATAASFDIDWTIQGQHFQGAANPTSNLGFGVNFGSGGFTQPAFLTSTGVFSPSLGFRINGSATSGQVLRGDGTNFVSAQLAFSDLSGSVAASQMPAHTGDVSSSAGSVVLTIGATKVTSAMLNADVFSTAHSWAGVQTLATPVINGLPTGTGIATANTVSTLVARDGSGNFSAGTITASLTGTASGNLNIGGGTLTGQTNIILSSNTQALTLSTQNSNSGSSAADLLTLGNDLGQGIAGFQLNSSNNTSLGGANSLNIGNYAFAAVTFQTNSVVRLTIAAGGDVSVANNLSVTTSITTPLYKSATAPTAVSGAGPILIGSGSTIAARMKVNLNGTDYWVPCSTTAF